MALSALLRSLVVDVWAREEECARITAQRDAPNPAHAHENEEKIDAPQVHPRARGHAHSREEVEAHEVRRIAREDATLSEIADAAMEASPDEFTAAVRAALAAEAVDFAYDSAHTHGQGHADAATRAKLAALANAFPFHSAPEPAMTGLDVLRSDVGITRRRLAAALASMGTGDAAPEALARAQGDEDALIGMLLNIVQEQMGDIEQTRMRASLAMPRPSAAPSRGSSRPPTRSLSRNLALAPIAVASTPSVQLDDGTVAAARPRSRGTKRLPSLSSPGTPTTSASVWRPNTAGHSRPSSRSNLRPILHQPGQQAIRLPDAVARLSPVGGSQIEGASATFSDIGPQESVFQMPSEIGETVTPQPSLQIWPARRELLQADSHEKERAHGDGHDAPHSQSQQRHEATVGHPYAAAHALEAQPSGTPAAAGVNKAAEVSVGTTLLSAPAAAETVTASASSSDHASGDLLASKLPPPLRNEVETPQSQVPKPVSIAPAGSQRSIAAADGLAHSRSAVGGNVPSHSTLSSATGPASSAYHVTNNAPASSGLALASPAESEAARGGVFALTQLAVRSNAPSEVASPTTGVAAFAPHSFPGSALLSGHRSAFRSELNVLRRVRAVHVAATIIQRVLRRALVRIRSKAVRRQPSTNPVQKRLEDIAIRVLAAFVRSVPARALAWFRRRMLHLRDRKRRKKELAAERRLQAMLHPQRVAIDHCEPLQQALSHYRNRQHEVNTRDCLARMEADGQAAYDRVVVKKLGEDWIEVETNKSGKADHMFVNIRTAMKQHQHPNVKIASRARDEARRRIGDEYARRDTVIDESVAAAEKRIAARAEASADYMHVFRAVHIHVSASGYAGHIGTGSKIDVPAVAAPMGARMQHSMTSSVTQLQTSIAGRLAATLQKVA